MANYYKEINKMLDKLLHKIMVLDKTGLTIGIKNESLSFLEIYIIKEIGKNKEHSIYNLVKETDIDRRNITTIISKLASGGYLKKEKSKDDKRVHLVRLTEEGIETYEKIIASQKDVLDFILNDITLNEEKAVLKFLSKVNQRLI